MLHLSISFMCCDLEWGGVTQSGPIINTQVLTGGSHSCNTTAISGLWNGGGTQGYRRKENKGEGNDWSEGGG